MGLRNLPMATRHRLGVAIMAWRLRVFFHLPCQARVLWFRKESPKPHAIGALVLLVGGGGVGTYSGLRAKMFLSPKMCCGA